jgi:hypothetical protein
MLSSNIVSQIDISSALPGHQEAESGPGIVDTGGIDDQATCTFWKTSSS